MALVVEHPQWGPRFPHYANSFRPRLHDAFRRYIAEEEATFEHSSDLIPLPLLETTLAVGENMHVVGFQTGDRIFPVLMDTIRKYSTIHGEGIFDHYYGFLCIRHLIRMVCIAILTKDGIFDDVLDNFEPDMPWERLMDALGDHTLFFVERSLRAHIEASSDDDNTAIFTAPLFVEEGALSHLDAQLLIDLLWKSRGTIIPLRIRDLLPGLPVLIFVISQLNAKVSLRKVTPHWLSIQDISLRCYLGCLIVPKQTHFERRILYRINQFIFEMVDVLEVATTYEIWLPMDEVDARTIVNMYANLLGPYPETPLILDSIVLRWVFCLLTNPKTRCLAFDKLVPSIFRTALGVLQAEIDKESEHPMPKDTLNIIRLVTHGTLEQICVFDSRKPTPEVWDALLEAIFDSGLYEIIGRILMLVTREREEPAQWDLFLHGITELHNAIGGHLEIPPTHSESATHEWSKLFYHLNYLGSRALNPSETPRRLLEDVLAAWLRLFGLDSLKSTIKKFKCAYPRCADPQVVINSYETKHICGRCGKKKYCSSKCQIMHWNLNKVGSHSRECL